MNLKFRLWSLVIAGGCFLPFFLGASPNIRIRLNTLGYLPDSPKQASVAKACANFNVIRQSDGQIILAGKTTGPVLNSDTHEQLYTADFSALHEEGAFQLDIPGVGRSAPFHVASDLYREPYTTVMRGFYLWRCGTAVSSSCSGHTFAHGVCHTNDAWLDYIGGGHRQKDASKGWHDAGDYNKYIVNAGITVGSLFRAWEDFEPKLRKVALGLPDCHSNLTEFLAELKWEMDWVLSMQASDGSVYHKVSTTKFGGFIKPERETAERYFTPWGSEATADFIGMTAQAARIFAAYDRAYSSQCLDAARHSYDFLQQHPDYHPADQTGFSTGPYEVNEPNRRHESIPNNRLWADAELWQTTGDSAVLTNLESRIRAIHGQVDPDFDWDEVEDLGLLTYLSSERPGRDPALVNLVRSNLLAVADNLLQARARHGYARPLGTTYYWGCNGGVARQTLLLMAAARLAKSSSASLEYRNASLDALNHLFGRNCYGRSFVTGLGFNPPLHPHDRRSEINSPPWPGYLVGGPHPRPTDWHDLQPDFRTNEIAINWNAALVYALAAFLPD
jgi:endoglucanase